MWLRTDKVSGTITCGFGIVMIVWASLCLAIVALQSLMLATTPMAQSPNFPPFLDVIHAQQSVFLIYLPISIAGGIIYAVAGYCVRRGSPIARRVAQANAIVGYVLIAAGSISSYRLTMLLMDKFGTAVDSMPPPANVGFQLFLSIFYAAIPISTFVHAQVSAAFPTALLYLLSRPRDQAVSTSPEPAEPA